MKKLVIVGGSGGIGSKIVEQFLKIDYKVCVLDISPIDIQNENLIYKNCDIRDYENVKNVVNLIRKKYINIDTLVICSAIQETESWGDININAWKDVIDTNLNGILYCLKEFSSIMTRGSSIVNISSIHSTIPRLNKFAYDASKAAMNILSIELAIELGAKGIRVNVIEPGYIDTVMNLNVIESEEKVIKKIPIRKIGKPIDVAKLTLFLASAEASYIHGAVIPIDGGRRLVK